jgi:hypothetical protein
MAGAGDPRQDRLTGRLRAARGGLFSQKTKKQLGKIVAQQ